MISNERSDEGMMIRSSFMQDEMNKKMSEGSKYNSCIDDAGGPDQKIERRLISIQSRIHRKEKKRRKGCFVELLPFSSLIFSCYIQLFCFWRQYTLRVKHQKQGGWSIRRLQKLWTEMPQFPLLSWNESGDLIFWLFLASVPSMTREETWTSFFRTIFFTWVWEGKVSEASQPQQ